MEPETPFLIGSQGVTILSDPAPWRERFDRLPAIAIPNALEPGFCARMVERAARTRFVTDGDIEQIGTRLVESPQLIGRAISLLLHSVELLRWLEDATGAKPLRAVAGRLAEMRASHHDALLWHDDIHDTSRRLAIIVNFSEEPFEGGQFQLRRKGESEPLLLHDHLQAGSVLIVAVRSELEHRVTPVSKGGPRRIYAGWFLTQPEHAKRALGSGI
jgi:2OG-Fe(II) oxygenase superfamily